MILRSPDPYTDAKGRARLTSTVIEFKLTKPYYQRSIVVLIYFLFSTVMFLLCTCSLVCVTSCVTFLVIVQNDYPF